MQDLEKALEQLKKEIAREEDYCIPDTKKSDKLKPLLKNLYDEASAATEKTFGPLKTLIIAGIDEESIWEELQTRSKPLAKFIERKTRVLAQKIDRKLLALEKKKQKKQEMEENSEGTDGDDSDAHYRNSDLYDDDEDEEDMAEEDVMQEENSLEGDDNDEDEEEEEEEDGQEDGSEAEGDEEEVPVQQKKKSKKSTSEDMAEDVEMEAWLDAFEEMEYKHRDKLEKREHRAKASTVESKEWDDDNNEDEEDDLDFVEKAMYDSEIDDDEDEEDDIDPRSIKYEDFFVDDSKSKGKGKKSKSSINKKTSKRVQEEEEEDDEDDDMDFEGRDDYEDSEEGEMEGGNDEDDDEEDDEDSGEVESEEEDEEDDNAAKAQAKKDTFLTSYQRRKKELAEQITELEKELIAEKAWELRGEVKAVTRPENSLLDLAVDIERSTKATPLITQEFTSTLEDVIMARIKDSRYNDPVPRNGHMDTLAIDPTATGNDQDLSQEKSKVGLGELYAEEYAKKMQSQEETLDVQTQAAREEVINLYNAVARELDALSHFFYSPKPVASEASAKVLATQRAMPALEMEDITPFSQNSSATAAAPEELLEHKRGKKVTLLSAAELTREDRKKLRRHNKEVKKTERAEQEKDTSIKNVRKQANKKLDEELRADKRVVLSDSAGKSKKHEDTNQFSKSSAFFSKLQEETQKQIRSTAKVGDKRRRDGVEDQRPAAAFKL